jgi:hypothetical protein
MNNSMTGKIISVNSNNEQSRVCAGRSIKNCYCCLDDDVIRTKLEEESCMPMINSLGKATPIYLVG